MSYLLETSALSQQLFPVDLQAKHALIVSLSQYHLQFQHTVSSRIHFFDTTTYKLTALTPLPSLIYTEHQPTHPGKNSPVFHSISAH